MGAAPADSAHLPLLYTYRRCPYAMRARMALLVAQQPFEAFEIALRDKPAALLALSPKATVPVLQLPDGRVLDESWDIMRWALQSHDNGHWWHPAQTPDNLDLLRRNDGDFKYHLDRYKYPERHSKETGHREDHRADAAAALLLPLEARLSRQPYLGGNSPCATDLAIFPFVRQFAAVDSGWFVAQQWPAVQRWLAAWVGSNLFDACMVKLAPHPFLSKQAVVPLR